ncbi:hypothetical protein TNCT_622181 [Trichonephila clavata]|uniref:Uncharacterized protein n=1 Tax=Trichonephila clavata TaxID=2740835 RepID=A0A8X6KL88_TRICU|nr:hypothetical protein TNCT_622181 [Trichonephila clavata]
MDFDSDSSHSDATSPTSLYPPSLDDLYDKLKNAKGSLEILTVCSFLDCKINDLPTYVFSDDAERNQYGTDMYSILNEARSLYRVTKLKGREEDDNIFRNWGFSSEKDGSLDFKTVSRKIRIKSSSPPSDASSAKKQRTDQPTCQNKYSSLNVEDPRKMKINLAPITLTWNKPMIPPEPQLLCNTSGLLLLLQSTT